MLKRYIEDAIINHFKELRQLVILVGPRQVGKTTLAKSLIPDLKQGVNYFNWDIAAHRKILLTQIFSGKVELKSGEKDVLVFDEIHKYPRWKNAIKGLFDKYEPNTHWIITGSAVLDVYRKGQDSLVGRSFNYHLCPFTVAELFETFRNKTFSLDTLLETEISKPDDETQNTFDSLLKFGGFPEPYLKKSDSFLRRWRATRLDKLINQDLASIEHLKHLALVEKLMFLLPERVGSPLSTNSLREDLEVHFATVKHWIGLLEKIFYGFAIYPYTVQSSRMLKKEAKWYLWDWTEIDNEGFRFENMVAVHLLKYVHYMNDLGIDELSLHYVRDKEKREADFLICRKRKPLLLVECKLHDITPSKSLSHFARILTTKNAIQLVRDDIDPITFRYDRIKVDVLPASSFLRELV